MAQAVMRLMYMKLLMPRQAVADRASCPEHLCLSCHVQQESGCRVLLDESTPHSVAAKSAAHARLHVRQLLMLNQCIQPVYSQRQVGWSCAHMHGVGHACT